MRRRDFIAGLGSAAAWPVPARAQLAAVPVIGYLRSGSRGFFGADEAAFRQGLASMGFVESRNVTIDYQYADGQYDRLGVLAADLLRGQAAVIYAADNASAMSAKMATTTAPVIFRVGGDPVQLGLVTSLSRPNGNMTGVSFVQTTTSAIRVQMLHEAAPNAAVMGLLVNPTSPNADNEVREAQAAARKLGLDLPVVNASAPRKSTRPLRRSVRHARKRCSSLGTPSSPTGDSSLQPLPCAKAYPRSTRHASSWTWAGS